MDIVERLREDARGGMAYHELSDDAADEIERLTAELTEARAALTRMTEYRDGLAVNVETLELEAVNVAELERENQVLREGLQAHWGEHLDARLKYMLEQRRGS